MRNHRVHPCCLRRRRAAHPQPWIHCLHGASRMVVEFKISRLCGPASPEINVRLVPHFEVPGRYFVDAVAINQVLRKRLHQCAPLVVICRRRDDLLIPERMKVEPRGHLLRRKTQLDKRLDPVLLESVVDVVDIRPVVHRLAVLIFVIHSHFVMEDRVKANIFEISSRSHLSQVSSIVFAQRKNGAPGAEHLFPIMRKGLALRLGVDSDGFCSGRGIRGDTRGQEQKTAGKAKAHLDSGFHGSFGKSSATLMLYRKRCCFGRCFLSLTL